MKMKITRQAFTSNLKQNRYQAQRLLVNKIALPIGAGALASWIIQILVSNTKEDAEVMEAAAHSEEGDIRPWWTPIARMLMQFLENYLDQVDPVYTEAPSDNGHVNNPEVKPEKPEKS